MYSGWMNIFSGSFFLYFISVKLLTTMARWLASMNSEVAVSGFCLMEGIFCSLLLRDSWLKSARFFFSYGSDEDWVNCTTNQALLLHFWYDLSGSDSEQGHPVFLATENQSWFFYWSVISENVTAIINVSLAVNYIRITTLILFFLIEYYLIVRKLPNN